MFHLSNPTITLNLCDNNYLYTLYFGEMEYLPQVEKLVEVLSFFVTKLPADLVNKDVFEEHMTSVNKIVNECRKTEFTYLQVKFSSLSVKHFPFL